MADRNSFVMYMSWATLFANLPDEQAGELIKAICAKQTGADYSVKDPAIAAIFAMVDEQLDKDAEKYSATCKARADAGRKGNAKRWSESQTVTNDRKCDICDHAESQTVTNDRKCDICDHAESQTVTNVADNEYEYESDNDNDNDTDTENEQPTVAKKRESKRENRKRFSPPTVAEVDEYCRERGNSVDAQRFVDYYASKGWVVGKTPMKDWKAAVRTWEGRETARSGTPGGYVDAIQHRFDPIKDWLQQEGNDDAGGV